MESLDMAPPKNASLSDLNFENEDLSDSQELYEVMDKFHAFEQKSFVFSNEEIFQEIQKF